MGDIMTERTLIPDKYKILSGSVLKTIAVVTMLIDHCASVLLRDTSIGLMVVVSILGRELTVYTVMRCIGRLAFPIYSFLLVEGFLHTRNRKKYGLNLLVFAFLSEIPWNLEHSGTWHCMSQNVFFTLFLGYLGLIVLEKYPNQRNNQAFGLLLLMCLSIVLKADYGCSGYGVILLFYVLRMNRLLQAVIGACLMPSRYIAGLAFAPISLYNGKRGYIKGKVKYVFYAIYPVHMLILYYLKLRWIGY